MPLRYERALASMLRALGIADAEAAKQERERVKFDSETWRTQMTELEHELDGAQHNEYGSRWVFTCKECPDSGRTFLKARLVAQGYDECVDSHLD